MRPRHWFSVGVRLFGLWVFFRGFGDLLASGAVLMRLSPITIMEKDFGGALSTASNYYLWYAAGYFALAIYLLLGAEQLTRLVFGESSTNAHSNTSDGPRADI